MNTFLSLITGLSLGSLLTIILKYYFENGMAKKKQCYEEKKSCYLGVLGALHKAAIESSDKHSKEFAYYQAIANLYGSNDVQKWIQEIIDTNGPKHQEQRSIAFKNLLSSMRVDLNKYI